jgi:hypothetical protein
LKFLYNFENTRLNSKSENRSKKVEKAQGKYFGMVIAIIFYKVQKIGGG